MERPDAVAALPSHQALIASLGAELTPVRRLSPPWLRMLGWLALVAIAAAGLLLHFGTAPMLQRFADVPELGWATAGAVFTAIGAAWAACALAVPGRSAAWTWLPVPGALVWLVASGAGCLRAWLAPPVGVPSTAIPVTHCLVAIVLISVPLSALLVWMLRRACPLRPVRTAVLVGLASAAGSAALLEIFHPYDAAATDFLIHALAVGIVVAANAALGNRLLSPRRV